MRVLLNSIVEPDLFAITAGMMTIAPKKIGPNIVAMMNHRVRTRSRYSRFMIAQSLAMSAHPHFDARRSNSLQEDLVKGRTDNFKPIDRCACGDNAMQQSLRVCSIRELDLEVPVGIVDTIDERTVGQHSGDLRRRSACESERNVP
jgi:hypothetical protein